jgi:hypothetical protein
MDSCLRGNDISQLKFSVLSVASVAIISVSLFVINRQ